MRRFVVIVLFALLLAACGVPTGGAPTAIPTARPVPTAAPAAADPCAPTDLQAYRAAYTDILNRWGGAMVAAGKARPEGLQTPISQLQRIAGELTGLKPPLCAQQANAETAEAMKQIIEGYQSLMASKDIGHALSDGIDKLSVARTKVDALPGTPAPTPTFEPTLTPLPTDTPVPTDTPTATPTATPTPLPRNGVITSRITQVFDSPTSTTPIKSLARGTRVLVFELQKGRLHIRAGNLDGWVSQGAVVIQ